MKRLEPVCTAGGSVIGAAAMEKVRQLLRKIKNRISK